MTRTGWVLTGLSSANMILDSLGKFMPPALLLEEANRLGESAGFLVIVGILEFTCGALSLIPKTAILGVILQTGFLGGAEAIQIRVSGSGVFLVTLPLFLGVLAWGGIWLRDERLRDLIPLSARRATNQTEVSVDS
jgi:DoxX-like family